MISQNQIWFIGNDTNNNKNTPEIFEFCKKEKEEFPISEIIVS